MTKRREWRRYQRFLAAAAATLALGGSLAACRRLASELRRAGGPGGRIHFESFTF